MGQCKVISKNQSISIPLRRPRNQSSSCGYKYPFPKCCRSLDADPGFVIETLTWFDVNEAKHLPFNDPFDCLIVGTAIRLGYPLITKDEAITDSKLVETVW